MNKTFTALTLALLATAASASTAPATTTTTPATTTTTTSAETSVTTEPTEASCKKLVDDATAKKDQTDAEKAALKLALEAHGKKDWKACAAALTPAPAAK